jgi:hypothetical protein
MTRISSELSLLVAHEARICLDNMQNLAGGPAGDAIPLSFFSVTIGVGFRQKHDAAIRAC